jgi:hypothetical protein
MLLNEMAETQRWVCLVGMNLEHTVFRPHRRARKGMVLMAMGVLLYVLGHLPAVQAWGGHVSEWWSG